MIAFRHADPRFPFLWQTADQPPARWHGAGEGPANYFADTPTGAWAEFIRHEELRDDADLGGVERSLWAVEVPDDEHASPELADDDLLGDEDRYPACQAEARRLRAAGAGSLIAPSAALRPGAAGGSQVVARRIRPGRPRDGRVVVIFGPTDATGWVAVERGRPPASVLPAVRHLRPGP